MLGLVQALVDAGQDFDLEVSLEKAKAQLPVKMSAEQVDECREFIVRRLQAQLLEEGYRHDVVDAVLNAQGNNPANAQAGVVELSKHLEHKVWPDVLDTYARCARITRDLESVGKVTEKLFEQDEEKALFAALEQAEADQSKAEAGDVLAFLKAFMPMMPAIKAFFDEVLVNAEDEKLRANRLALLQQVTALAVGVADLSKMEGF